MRRKVPEQSQHILAFVSTPILAAFEVVFVYRQASARRVFVDGSQAVVDELQSMLLDEIFISKRRHLLRQSR